MTIYPVINGIPSTDRYGVSSPTSVTALTVGDIDDDDDGPSIALAVGVHSLGVHSLSLFIFFLTVNCVLLALPICSIGFVCGTK